MFIKQGHLIFCDVRFNISKWEDLSNNFHHNNIYFFQSDSFAVSVRSQENYLTGSSSLRGSRRYTRNPLITGSLHGYAMENADNISLNGSNATTASTATVGSHSPQTAGSR